MKRGLVLGGGGVVGLAWESGVICGLLDAAVDLREAELIAGTSAGSLIGTRLAAGQDLRELAGRSGAPVPMPEGGPDLETLGEVFGRWSSIEHPDKGFLTEIGALAARARTVAEDVWIAATGGSVGVEDWPSEQLRLIAVDIESGELAAHDRASGAPLAAAIAASCAIPGMFPPITINTRRFMDGGIRSGTSADVLLADRPELVLVIAPICRGTASFGALAERCLEAEREQLEAAGARVVTVLPLEAEQQAFGENLMDPARAGPAREAGYERGRALAPSLGAAWG